MPKHLTIHIGLHKTGTTALQHFFAANEKMLLGNGILYPVNLFPRHRLQHSALLDVVSNSKVGELDGVFRYLSRGSTPDVLLSGEDLVIPRYVNEIAPAARRYFDRITVVMVVRNKSEWLYSQFIHHMRYSDYFVTPGTFFKCMRLNPSAAFSKWSEFSDRALLIDYDDHSAPITSRFLRDVYGVDSAGFEQLDVHRNAGFDIISSFLLNSLFEGLEPSDRQEVVRLYNSSFGRRSTFGIEDTLRAEINAQYPDSWWSFPDGPNWTRKLIEFREKGSDVDSAFLEGFSEFVGHLRKISKRES